MKCRFEKIVLTAYHDKMLNIQKQKKLEEHLLKCPVCNQDYGLFKDTISSIKTSEISMNIGDLWKQMANIIEKSIIPLEKLLKKVCYIWCGICTILIAGFLTVYFFVKIPDEKIIIKKEDVEISLWKERILHLRPTPFNIEQLTIQVLVYS